MMEVRKEWCQSCQIGLVVPPQGPAANSYPLPLLTEFALPRIPTIFSQFVESHCYFKAYMLL